MSLVYQTRLILDLGDVYTVIFDITWVNFHNYLANRYTSTNLTTNLQHLIKI